jgi:hypothetical protein
MTPEISYDIGDDVWYAHMPGGQLLGPFDSAAAARDAYFAARGGSTPPASPDTRSRTPLVQPSNSNPLQRRKS